MASVNKVILLGRLGKDPELRYTQGGQPVCGFSLCTHEVWRDKAGEKQESLEWHNVTVWGKVGENCEKYLKKGSQAYIEGQIKTDSYEKDGKKLYTTKIVARDVKFLGSKSESSGAGSTSNFARKTEDPPKPASTGNLEDIPF